MDRLVLYSYSVVVILVLAYMTYLLAVPLVPKEKRALWFFVLLLGNLFAIPVFWYHYVWKVTGQDVGSEIRSTRSLRLQGDKERLVEDYQLLIDLHKGANRQGPGGDAETERALGLAMIDRAAPLKIADIGCGTGASTLLLAGLLNARITAVDFLKEFLEVLEGKAEKLGLAERIDTLSCSMDNLPFGDEEYDLVWSEGAITAIVKSRVQS